MTGNLLEKWGFDRGPGGLATGARELLRNPWVRLGLGVVVAAAVLAFLFLPPLGPGEDRGTEPVVRSAAADDGPLRIGLVLPMTGPGAVFADYIKDGADLATAELNRTGKVRVRLSYEDSKNQPAVGISAYNKLLLGRAAPPVVVVALSSVAKALAPLATESKVVQVYIAVAIPDITDGRYRFRVYPEANGMAGVMADFAAERLGARRGAVIYINDEFGNVSVEAFGRRFGAHGGTVVFTESYEPTQSDYRQQIVKLKAVNPPPEVIYLNGYGPAYANIVRQLREADVRSQLTADMTLGLPSTLGQVGEAAEGAYLVDGRMDPEFEARFRAAYNKPATSYAGYAYDIVRAVAEARATTGSANSEAIALGLHQLRDWPGVMGPITIKPDGDSTLEFVVKRVQGGRLRPVSE